MNFVPNKKNNVDKLSEDQIINNILLQKMHDATPPEDIRRVVRKLADKYIHFGDLSSFGDLETVIPSTLGVVSCMKIYRDYQKKAIVDDHPRYRTEAVMEFNNQTLSDDRVFVHEGEKIVEKKINMGMVVEPTLDMPLACAATLLNIYTQEKEGSIIQVLDDSQKSKICKIPDVSMVSVREFVMSKIASVPESLNYHYAYFKRNIQYALFVMDKMYSLLPDYSATNDKFASVCNQYMEKKGHNVKSGGFCPCTKRFNAVISDDVTINQHWILINLCQGYLGGDKKRGGLLSGYYNYDTTSAFRKGWDRAREVMSIARSMGFDVIKMLDSKFSALAVRILIANGFKVIMTNGLGHCRGDSLPGVYAYASVPAITILENKISQPTVKKAGVTYSNDFSLEFGSIFCANRTKGIQMVYTYLVPGVIDVIRENGTKYGLYPTLSGHSGRVWMIKYTVLPKTVPTSEQMIKRNLEMCFTRNVFALTRKPYYPNDEFGSWFVKDVFVPKIVRSEKDMGTDYFKIVDFRDQKNDPVASIDPNDYIRMNKPMIVDPLYQLRFAIMSKVYSVTIDDFPGLVRGLHRNRDTTGEWEMLCQLVRENALDDDYLKFVRVFCNSLDNDGNVVDKVVQPIKNVGNQERKKNDDDDNLSGDDLDAISNLAKMNFEDLSKKI